MNFIEEKGNLFDVDDKYYLVHCISADCKMGAGIAVEFQKRFDLRSQIMVQHPMVYQSVRVGRVFNLITKRHYYGKPTYESMWECLQNTKRQCGELGIKYLAMPEIGCGLDGLKWGRVRNDIKNIFEDTSIEIIIKHRNYAFGITHENVL